MSCKQQLKKKDFSTSLKFTLACSIQRALGSSICSNEMLLDTIRAKVFMLNAKTKNGAMAKTNGLAKSCDVLHVVTCREPAGLDQTPEAGRNTKGNITKPFESIIFGGYQNSCKANKFKKKSKHQLIETQKTRSHSTPLPFSENSYFIINHFLLSLVTPCSNRSKPFYVSNKL